MPWRGLGHIFTANGQRAWMQSHCSMPFAEPLTGTYCRIWFTARNKNNHSHVAWLEIDLQEPSKILALSQRPALAPGFPSTFDELGVMGSWIVKKGTQNWHYYVGWSDGGAKPFHVAIGLATQNGNQLRRHSSLPVLDRSATDPYFVSTPCVIKIRTSWHLWYLSGTGWSTTQPTKARYKIAHATSKDGVNWTPNTNARFEFTNEYETACARPSVIFEKGVFHMWFCVRGDTSPYRLAYAESSDGQRWSRKDKNVAFQNPPGKWENEMRAYPHVFDQAGSRWMVTAGNGFGRGGMGLAVLENS